MNTATPEVALRCTICNSETRRNCNSFGDSEHATCSPHCEKRRQSLAKMVGLVYWLDRNQRGWGQAKVYAVDGTLLRVEDCQGGDRYPVDPKDLKTEWSLTHRQKRACGLEPSLARVWRVNYQCAEDRDTRRPFWKKSAYVTAESREQAIGKVKAVFGPPRYDHFSASPAPEGVKADSFFG